MLSLEDLQDIKIPVDLFAQIPFAFCKKYKVLPLRLETQSGILSFVFVDPQLGLELEQMQTQNGWMHMSAYRIDEDTFNALVLQCEGAIHTVPPTHSTTAAAAAPTRIVALVEPDPRWAKVLQEILELEHFEVLPFPSEQKLTEVVDRTTAHLSERTRSDEPTMEANEDKLLEMAASQSALPFTHILLRSQGALNDKKFAERIWARARSLKISWLEPHWFASRIFNSGVANSAPSDIDFYVRHGDFFHAGLEYLQQGDMYRAVELFERVPSANAYYLRSQIILGKVFLKKKNYNKASEHFQRAYDHWCEDPDAIVDENVLRLLYHLAYTFEKLNRLDDSLKLYERVAGENPLFREVGARMARVKENIRKANASQEKKMGLPAFSRLQREQTRYEKMEELGRGGMGIVYRTKDRILGRELALKVLNSHFKHDEKIVETFLREAKSLAALNHLHIVTIFDAGIEDGNYYIAMEFIEGRTVRDLLKARGSFRLSTALSLARQVLKALSYAHSKKVIHRDITTNNMMLTESKIIKLMDFGLARVVNQLHSEQSIIGGTPYFMSPEQVEGAPIDHRTDIYSFGVCLFEMTSGQVPFPMENPGYHHLHTKAPDVRTVKADLPEELAQVIARCLEKKPDDRYQSAEAIMDDLKKVQVEIADVSSKVSTPKETKR